MGRNGVVTPYDLNRETAALRRRVSSLPIASRGAMLEVAESIATDFGCTTMLARLVGHLNQTRSTVGRNNIRFN